MSASNEKFRFGIIGLGVMGRNLLLNMAEHGFAVAGYDTLVEKIEMLEDEGKGKKVKGFTHARSFVQSLATPRAIIMMVPAGKIVDSVIEEMAELLDEGDILIDGGNSHFSDTTRRAALLKPKGLHFFGMGISGGEEGARKGPSMMPGGDKEAYKIMQPIFEAIAARVDNEPCVAYIGPGASGHFVKMVHNGIEYALMQLIAETYEILQKGLQLDNQSIHKVFEQWNNGRLQSFLIEITRDIFAYRLPESGDWLIDRIKDEARSKGTGKWTSIAAMEMQAPITAIDTAVAMRDLSKYKKLRVTAEEMYKADVKPFEGDRDQWLTWLEQAYYFSMTITYAQGLHLLHLAGKELAYELKLDEIAKIWRGGCIIRSLLLNDIYKAWHSNPQLEHLLLYQGVVNDITDAAKGTRKIITGCVAEGIAVPAYAACISYFDTFRSGRMPSNLIQAQRDYFGAHTYEIIGEEGVHHTEWQKLPQQEKENPFVEGTPEK